MSEFIADEMITVTTPVLDQLQARVESTRAAAVAAQAEAAKLAAVLERLQIDAQAAEEAALLAAQEAAYEVQKQEADTARTQAEVLLDHASQISNLASARSQEAAVLNKQALEARNAADAAVMHARRLVSELKPAGKFVRTEHGGFVEVETWNARDRQVTSTDGRILDHVSEHSSGDWVYRFRTGR